MITEGLFRKDKMYMASYNFFRVKAVIFTFLFLPGLIGCKDKEKAAAGDVKTMEYVVKAQWKHDTEAFTQGLVIHEGKLYESTGQEKSWVGIIDIKTGKPDK